MSTVEIPISFKTQTYLALVPYFGFFLVVFTSFYNIYKIKNSLYIGIFFLLALLPCALFLLIATMLFYFFIIGQEPTLSIILSLILFFVTMLCMAITCLWIEKNMINKIGKTSDR